MADVTISGLGNLAVSSELLLPVSNSSTTGKLTIGDINSLVTKTSLGLGSVENKSSATIRGEITSSNVTTALGFTPYNATNPSGYITGITSSNVTTALGYTPIPPTSQAIAKAWVSFTGIGTNGQPVTTLDKYNVSSVVRNTINSWTINFTAGTFSNANYIVTGCGRFQNSSNNDSAPLFGVHRFTDPTTSACRVSCIWNAGSVEIQTVYAAFFGL